MINFKIGDRVRISETSKYYNQQTSGNPRCDGTISAVYPNLKSIHVSWDNNHHNSYSYDDLVLCEELPDIEDDE